MKKIILLLLVLAFLISGCKVQNKTTEKKSVHTKNAISSVEDFEKIRKNPNKNYVITDNIDFGGKEFPSIPEFSGDLSAVWAGNFNYTLSNFKLKVKKTDEVTGFFGKTKGNIKNINFKDVTVEIESGFNGDFGILCGNSSGEISDIYLENCNITGSNIGGNIGALIGVSNGYISNADTKGSIVFSNTKNLNLGGIVGKSDNIEFSESRCDISITSCKNPMILGGISGESDNALDIKFGGKISVNSTVKTNVSQLIGKCNSSLTSSYANAEGFTVSNLNQSKNIFIACGDGLDHDCLQRDISNLDVNINNGNEYSMRKTARDYMYRICTIPWKAGEDLDIHDGCTDSNGDPRHDQSYKKGEWYFGMPYSHYYSPLERFGYYLNADSSTKTELNGESFKLNMGNDCVGSIFCALQQISPSPSYATTQAMVLSSGMVAVGNYSGKRGGKTSDICDKNGENVMYEAYSHLKMGDVLLTVSSYNHGMFVSEAPFIYRKPDGKIDTEKSYVITFEQGYGVSSLNYSHSTCTVKAVHTFDELFYSNFIPITVPEYEKGESPKLELSVNETEHTVDGILSSVIKSNYCIYRVKAVISKDGKEIATKEHYPNTVYDRKKCRLSMVIEKTFFNSLDIGEEYVFSVFINGENDENKAISCTFIK